MEREKMIEEMKSCADSAYYNWDNAPKDPIWRICEGLYDAHYRKIPDGAVVLTKEDYDNMRNLTDCVVCENESNKRKDSQIEQARKDTAREILQTLYNNSDRPYFFNEYIKTLAEKYGVEVEE